MIIQKGAGYLLKEISIVNHSIKKLNALPAFIAIQVRDSMSGKGLH